MKSLLALCLQLCVLSGAVAAIACNASSHCPKETPCCSQYGTCGIGSYCLGSCDPRYSYSLDACMPVPVCKNVSTTFTSTDQFISVDKFLGNASQGDWIYEGTILDYDDSIVLAMPKDSSGAVVSSSRFVWYGRMEAKMKTSHRAGVVTAFILFSNTQDEIDFENVGVDLYKFQTNYYYHGVLNYTHSQNITTDDSTFDNYHTLAVDWSEDKLDFIVNGKVGRTLHKKDTWNETTQQFMYPQTPSRMQLSLWPPGASSDIGTVNWGGGAIDWDAEDLTDPGYYYAFIKEASIQCYDPPAGTNISGNSAYVYTTANGNQSDIRITNDKTYLGSLQNTGLDPGNNKKNKTKSSTTASKGSSVPTGVGSSGHGGDSDGDDDDDGDSATTTSAIYTGAGFMQFSSSTDASSSSKAAAANNMAKLVVDVGNTLTFGCVAVSLVVTFMII